MNQSYIFYNFLDFFPQQLVNLHLHKAQVEFIQSSAVDEYFAISQTITKHKND